MENHAWLGFILLRPWERPAEFDDEVTAEKLHTVSDSLSDVIPNYPLLNWAEDYAAASRKRLLTKGYLGQAQAGQLAHELTEMCDEERLEFSCRFYELEDAQAIRDTYFADQEDWKVVTYGILTTARAAISDRCKEATQSGILASLARDLEVPADKKILGYDILNVEMGEFSHSFLNQNLQKVAREKFGIELNEFGLIEDEAEAIKLAAHFPGGPWFPVVVAEVV